MSIVYISLLVNIVVAGFWGGVLLRNFAPHLSRPFGVDSPGLRILASLYTTIAFVSLFALIETQYLVTIVAVLFPLQIFYKLLSLIAVNDSKNPIVISNIAIAILHMISLYVLFT